MATAQTGNPFLSGLATAMGLANLIQRTRMEQAQLKLAQDREANDQAYQSAMLQTKLNELGARPYQPTDELEESLGGRLGSAQGPNGAIPIIEPSDLKGRIVKAGGSKWVLPNEQERRALRDRDAADELGRKTREATALADVQQQAAIKGSKAKLDALGIEISPENASLLGLKAGARVLPENLDDLMRSVATAKASKAQEDDDVRYAYPFQGEKDQYLATVDRKGKVKLNPLSVGKKPATGRPASTAPSSADIKRATQEAVAKAASELYAGAGGDPDKAEAALKTGMAKDPFLKAHAIEITGALRKAKEKPKSIAQMTPDELMGYFGQVAGGAGGEEKPPAAAPAKASAPAAPAPAPAKPQVRPGGSKNALEYIQKLKARSGSAGAGKK